MNPQIELFSDNRLRDLCNAMAAHQVARAHEDPFVAVHEVAHALDLGLKRFDVHTIERALLATPLPERRQREITASAVPFVVMRRLGVRPKWTIETMAGAVVQTALNNAKWKQRERIRWTRPAMVKAITQAIDSAEVRALADRILSPTLFDGAEVSHG